MKFTALALTAALLCCAAAPALAINKCTDKGGKVVYQETPCQDGAQGASVRVFAGQGDPSAQPVPRKEERQAAEPAPADRPVPSQAASLGPQAGTGDGADALVAQCLNWYRPRLKNPAGAYADGASRNGSVLTITVYGTNSFGGYVGKQAACEIKHGRIDADWTKIHAQRAGWP